MAGKEIESDSLELLFEVSSGSKVARDQLNNQFKQATSVATRKLINIFERENYAVSSGDNFQLNHGVKVR